ncbi:sigma 54-interacting transcriptional regulator [Enterobacillus tribolii]|uniref:Formate hydrogenlyase transcriptional activator n=1 Tax=Enterobacillus tribolii TaxID=1487935 RepID=A0A370Q4M8_9GAMM|nr:sigma 54-interacting transcriptional regulator [Enterobacillus tribolii]MBW7985066.1 GAF domain-containing protein [Enterobacillus tribolii]RDK83294.1 formate hydrogenlyase transcriptional activator [Enterobacillus tribolii]
MSATNDLLPHVVLSGDHRAPGANNASLYSVLYSVLTIKSLPALLDVLQCAAIEIMGAEEVRILHYEPEQNRIMCYGYDKNHESFLSFPQEDDTPPAAFSSALRHPLVTPSQRLGDIMFLRSDPFRDEERATAVMLADVTAIALENLLEKTLAEQEEARLRHERDHCRILVDVTNAVTSKLELDALAGEVSREIHRFFGIDYIGLSLFDQDDSRLKTYVASYQRGKPVLHEQTWIPLAGSLAQQVIESENMLLMDLHDSTRLAPHDRQLAQMLELGHQTICQLPLVFGHKVLGVLKLAQCRSSVFDEDNLTLLRQIAARIAIAVDNALAYAEISRLKDNLVHENHYLTEQIRQEGDFSEIVGQSRAIKAVLEQVEMVAASDTTVLILGETGTGKELIAQAVHDLSGRSDKRMVKMNCAAIPATLLESDLFGHEKGAYTGAAQQRMGRFELAHQGSLFLDEVGDIPLELQPKLLRVLQEKEIERLGGNKVIPVDVRLIAATNRDLKQMVEDREYRSDLYYRLNVFPIMIPPLRERPEDIPLLVKFFTAKIARRMNRTITRIPTEAIRRLSALPWPGNIRELENIIERAVILTRGPVLALPLDAFSSARPQPVALTVPAADAGGDERERILQALRDANGIVAGPRGAATRLGLKRTTLISRMQKMGISGKDYLK